MNISYRQHELRILWNEANRRKFVSESATIITMTSYPTCIQFLWIKKYKVLENIGFNLSNEYHFTYDSTSGSLSVKKSPHYIPGFFGDQVHTVTGIVGENGSGKTTFIDLLTRFFKSDGFPSNVSGLLVYSYEEKKLHYHHTPDIKVQISGPLESSFPHSYWMSTGGKGQIFLQGCIKMYHCFSIPTISMC